MTRYGDIDNSYLDDAAQRITNMIPLACAPDKVQVVRYIDGNLTPPFWWVYIGLPQLGDLAEDISTQNYELICRYVIGFATQGYDGTLQQTVFRVMPRVLNYLRAHANLKYADASGAMPYTTTPKYLVVASVRIAQASMFGAFTDGTNQVGIEIRVILPFKIGIDQEYQ